MLGFGTIAKKVFGTPNDRKIKATRPTIEKINALEPEFEKLTDQGLIDKTAELKARLEKGEKLDDLLPEAFANCREAARRALGLRAFDVQLMGGIFLHEGNIAEMKTGEGNLPRLSERAHRQGRAYRDSERLPRQTRRGLDGQGVCRARDDDRRRLSAAAGR